MKKKLGAPTIAALVFFSLRLAGAVLSPDDCSQSVDIPEISFSTSPLSCAVVWTSFNFILRHYYDKSSQRLSIVLSASTASNWFSIGFSPTGAMIGASAMVGYMSVDGGEGVINQYYLKGKTTNLVIPKEGNLTVVPESGLVRLQNQTIYMAFQLDITESQAASSKLIYAYAPIGQTPNASGYMEGPHQADYGMSFDFTTGSSSSISNPTKTLRKSHGVVNIFAWAILAPVGAFISRYLRQREPLWFRLHLGFQSMSYVFGTTGVILGIKLSQELPGRDWKNHRIVGVFVIFLATLQVLAICARPKKDSRYRNIWSWYHYLVGRFVLFLAAANIVLGLQIANAAPSWKAGYGLILVITLIAFIVFESLYWLKWRKQSTRPVTGLSSYEMM